MTQCFKKGSYSRQENSSVVVWAFNNEFVVKKDLPCIVALGVANEVAIDIWLVVFAQMRFIKDKLEMNLLFPIETKEN